MPAPRRINQDSERPNTIGLRDKELAQFLDKLESAGNDADHPKREFARWMFRQPTVVVRIDHPGGSRVDVKVACRNLSQGGIGLLHNTYIHPGSTCAVRLDHTQNGETWIPGEITRCTHAHGVIHQIGVKFKTAINIRDFVRQDALDTKLALEVVDPEDIAGCLVHVDTSEMDQQIVRHFLRGTRLRLRTASTAEEGIALAKEGCDIVLCDYMLGETNAMDFVYQLRGDGVTVPIVLCTSDSSKEVRDNIRSARANAFLAKPFTQDVLLRGIAEFLMAEREENQGGGASDGGNAELAQIFVSTLRDFAARLETAMEDGKPNDVYVICNQIKGSARSVGFKSLGDRADEIANRLSGNMSIPIVSSLLREFIAACRTANAA